MMSGLFITSKSDVPHGGMVTSQFTVCGIENYGVILKYESVS
jgi:hypothetical protein